MIYQSPTYSPDKVYRRYVKLAASGLFEFVEIDKHHYSIRQDNVDFNKLPAEIADQAIKLTGHSTHGKERPVM